VLVLHGPSGRPIQVTRLRADGPRLWIATAGQGVARVEVGGAPRVRWFTRANGLADDLAWDVLPVPGGALVATVAGVSSIDGDAVAPVAAGDVRALADFGNRVVAARAGVGLDADGAPLLRDGASVGRDGALAHVRVLVPVAGGLLALGEDGAALLGDAGVGGAGGRDAGGAGAGGRGADGAGAGGRGADGAGAGGRGSADGAGARGGVRVIASLQPAGLPSPDVTALAAGDGALYVGTFDRGAARLMRGVDSLDVTPLVAVDERVNAIAARAGEVWVGTARGATRVTGAAATTFASKDGLADDHVNAILAETDAVTIATTHGLAIVDAAGVRRVTVENGLPASRLTALARATDGALWVGGAHGAARWDGAWSLARALDRRLPDDFVTAVAADGASLWVGTYSSGMARRDPGGGWSPVDGAPLWVNPGAIAAWAGRVFVGTNGRGLAIFDGHAWRTLTVADGLPADDVTAFAVDEDGLWVGTRGGLARVVVPALGAVR
jgi:Two component regulator propeller